jgi:hypothetical protein
MPIPEETGAELSALPLAEALSGSASPADPSAPAGTEPSAAALLDTAPAAAPAPTVPAAAALPGADPGIAVVDLVFQAQTGGAERGEATTTLAATASARATAPAPAARSPEMPFARPGSTPPAVGVFRSAGASPAPALSPLAHVLRLIDSNAADAEGTPDAATAFAPPSAAGLARRGAPFEYADSPGAVTQARAGTAAAPVRSAPATVYRTVDGSARTEASPSAPDIAAYRSSVPVASADDDMPMATTVTASVQRLGDDGGGPAAAEAPAGRASGTIAEASPAAAAAPPAAGGAEDEAQIAKIAEKVWATIRRRLAVERERQRGMP